MSQIDAITLEGSSNEMSGDHAYTRRTAVSLQKFCEDLYYHSGGFYDGSYLIPFDREAFYEKRKEHAYLRNFLAKIQDASIGGVFSEDIGRTTDSALLDAFVENPMQNGYSMSDTISDSILYAMNGGVVFAIVDNFKDLPETTESSLIDSGLLPYVYFRKADSVNKFSLDKFGLLESITFSEGKKTINGKEVETFKYWDYFVWREFWRKGNQEYTIDEGNHGLKQFPVYPLTMGKKQTPDELIPSPRFLSIAILNFALYNLDSECRDNILASMFPILVGSGFRGITSIQIGSKGLIDVPEGTALPTFISPDAGIFDAGIKAKEELESSLLQLAEQSGVSAVEKSTSGASKAYDFYASATIKKEISRKAKHLEYWIIKQVADYLSIDSYEYTADYPQTFTPNESEQFTKRLTELDLVGIPKELKNYYLSKIAQQDMTGEDPDKINKVLEAIENEPDTLPPE
jgi:hypothetical protein